MSRRAKAFVAVAILFALTVLPAAAAPRSDVGSAKVDWVIRKAHQVIDGVKDPYHRPPPPSPDRSR